MKAVINEKETEVKYPWIGILKDREGSSIVYFIENNCGVCIDVTGEHGLSNTVGEYNTHWIEKRFTPFTGTITLSND